MSLAHPPLYIGLMSGTSLDGVDAALTSFAPGYRGGPIDTMATAYVAFSSELRQALLALQSSAPDEIHREAQIANVLAQHYAECVLQLLHQAALPAHRIAAIGVHGQTIRHRPELGYTRQTNNPALLAELTGIDVIADFRSRDIAAGGQGAPLVPAFHQAVFAADSDTRVVANIGGISNISVLPARDMRDPASPSVTTGFDTGPGNVLMDAWISQHQGLAYDQAGQWAASGTVLPALLQALLDEPFFRQPPPKSTGRDLFHPAWLRQKLASFGTLSPADVQATLAAFTAITLADAISMHAPAATAVYAAGGGAYNTHLLQQLQLALDERARGKMEVVTTSALGISPNHVEALAFAWLAHRFCERCPGNLPAVTGARGERILGALYPA